MFMIMLGVGIIIPHLNYYAQEMGATSFQIGLLIATYPIVQFFVSPFFGRWSDRIGRRPVILFGLVCNTLALLGFGLSQTLWQLFIARAIWGLASAISVTITAYVADTTDEEHRGTGMGLIGAAVGLGFILGPALGAVFGSSHHLPFIISSCLSSLNTVFVVLLLAEPGNRISTDEPYNSISLKALLTHRLTPLFLVAFIASFAFAGIETIFPQFIKDRWGYDTRELVYILVVSGLIAVGLQGGLIGRLINRFGEFWLIVTGLLAMAVGLAILPWAANFPTLLAYFCLIAIGSNTIRPTNSAWISRYATAEQGTAIGFMNSYISLGRILGPITSGLFYTDSQKRGVVSGFLVNQFTSLESKEPPVWLQWVSSAFDLPYLLLSVVSVLALLFLLRPLMRLRKSLTAS